VPCIREAPEIARLARTLGPGAALIGVDWNDTTRGARAFVRRHGWRFPVLVDDKGKAGERYRLVGLPTTFVIDRRGRVVARRVGPQTAAGMLTLARAR
jgi:peroxiredoxin